MRLAWISIILIFVGCTETEEPKKKNKVQEEKTEIDPFAGLTFEQAIEKHIKTSLKTSPSEEFTYEIFTGDCDGDDSLDHIVTVNLLD